MRVTEEEVDDMLAVLKMGGGVAPDTKDKVARQLVRKKLEEGKVPCFEQMKWVRKGKRDEMV